MISYITVGSSDFAKSVPFFTELLATQGVSKMFDNPKGGAGFAKDGKLVLGVVKPFNGEAATVGNGTMIALDMPSREAVDAFHAKALELGGSDEGAPGERGPGYYMAYFRDPDGNKFCACKLG
ncbi:Catechol 2,3-dioxygenase [Sphingomonas sp. YR710]|jgi:catechol 2,3-dioxygenase-like lactoylglutathione lyase family enzyme|uniref:VOC family protein n=1 Tax=Sphingomonas sp. YR710 TaxID=1882773 RepID=UPI00088DB849|nr:VOC family protein [Sphingomonas sp. YR710]SDD58352.1 Catechol 2,3-dioxygenase [Sphingomonas sp. YR710]